MNNRKPTQNDITRQISFLMNNYTFEEGEDKDNKCILIPRYRAVLRHRMAPDGKRYTGSAAAKDEFDLVPVRSIVTKEVNPDDVTEDLLGTQFSKADITIHSAIGSSFATSLTEATTQSVLGLKHGGHERVLDTTGYLRAPKACTLDEEDNFIVLKTKSESLKYPRPETFIKMGPTSFEKGDIVGTAYNTTSPIYKLNSLIKLMQAQGSKGKRYFEKDDIIVSDCYALESGKIEYRQGKYGTEVWIGQFQYDYNPKCMYYFPNGAEVRKFDRICSGVVNMNHVINICGTNLRDIYTIFRKQFYSITDGGYIKNGFVDDNSVQEELVEMLFISLIRVNRKDNELKNDIESIEFRGTNGGIRDNDSFYTVLSWGYASSAISKALKGELKVKGDLMTEVVLGLLLNDKLDEKPENKKLNGKKY